MGEDGGGYVHDPAAFESADESGERRDSSNSGRDSRSDADGTASRGETTAGTGSETPVVDAPDRSDPSNREFGRRGWILVGVIAFAFVICPLAIILRPPGTGYLFALLILPLAPAVLLAITAVWATTRP